MPPVVIPASRAIFRNEDFSIWLAQNAVNESKKILLRIPADDSYPFFNVSDFFLKNIVGFNLNLVREMLLADISFDTMLGYESEISSFFYNGWKALLNQYSAWFWDFFQKKSRLATAVFLVLSWILLLTIYKPKFLWRTQDFQNKGLKDLQLRYKSKYFINPLYKYSTNAG